MVYFFDLDATLLQMDQNEFLKQYMKKIGEFAYMQGFPVESFMKLFQKGIYNMITSDGSQTNKEAFWSALKEDYDTDKLDIIFTEFYEKYFDSVSFVAAKNDLSNKIIKKLKEQGHTLVLATTPLFPMLATEKRIKWAGLDKDDFICVTAYEDYHYSKPNPKYFLEIIEKYNLSGDFVMVGNDMFDDFYYLPKNFKKVLITDYLINEKNLPITEEYNPCTLEEFYNSL